MPGVYFIDDELAAQVSARAGSLGSTLAELADDVDGEYRAVAGAFGDCSFAGALRNCHDTAAEAVLQMGKQFTGIESKLHACIRDYHTAEDEIVEVMKSLEQALW